jgi:hypothetical protein
MAWTATTLCFFVKINILQAPQKVALPCVWFDKHTAVPFHSRDLKISALSRVPVMFHAYPLGQQSSK